MTTPASNIDSGLATPTSLYDQYLRADGTWSNPSLIANSTNTLHWRTYIRPQSVRNQKDGSGWRAPSAYSLVREGSSASAGVVIEEYHNPSDPHQASRRLYYDGFGLGWRLPRPTFYESSLLDRAVSSALQKLKGQTVNFGVAFGEYKETAELVAHTAERIGSAVRAFRGKHPRDWGQVVRNQTGRAINGRKSDGRASGIPNSWLELQYGWNPLMADVNASCEALSDRSSQGHPYRVHVTGRAKSSIDKVDWGSVNGNSLMSVRLESKGQNFCFVRLDYELDSPLLATLSSLGLTNPLEIAWELVPYSFVVDWFLPIGGWLGTLDADFGWRFLAGTNTLGYKYDVTGTGPYDRLNNSAYSSSGSIRSKQSVFSMARNVYSSSPRAGFPTVKNPLSAGHVANALSLLVSAFR